MNAEMEKVLNRVKKMLNLANNSAATEGERDNALRMAHAALAKYNLSMADVEAAGNTLDNDPRVKEEFDHDANTDWTRRAAGGVGKLFFCFYYRQKYAGGTAKHVFVGKSLNVLTATYMTEYVINSIKREAEKAVKLHYGEAKLNNILDKFGFNDDNSSTIPEASKGAWQLAFCIAAADKVAERCKQLADSAAQQRAEGSTGTSLVLASLYKNERQANALFLSDLGVKLKSVNFQQGRNVTSARAAGSEFGSRLNLSQQIGNSRHGSME